MASRIASFAVLMLAAAPLFAASYTSTTNGNWSSASTWGGSGVPGAGDTATVNNIITLDVPVTVNTLTMNNTITGTQTLTVTNTFQWNGGSLAGGLTASVPSGSTLSLMGVGTLDGSTLSIGGVFNFTSTYYIYLQNNASLSNSGTINFQGDNAIYLSGSVGSTAITNNGTLEKTGGTGTSTITVPLTANSGSQVLGQSGTLDISAAITSSGATFSVSSGATLTFDNSYTHSFDAATTIAGAGTINFNGGTNSVSANYNVSGTTLQNGGTTTLSSITAINALTVNSGTITLNGAATLTIPTLTMNGGTLNGTLPINVSATSLTWTGGTVAGSGALTIPAATTITFNGYVNFDTRAVSNAGAMTFSSSYYAYFYNGATLTNSGTVNFQGDGGFYIGSGSPTITNNGTIEKTGGTGSSGLQVALIANSGSQLLIQSGNLNLGNVSSSGSTLSVASGATATFYWTTTATFDAASSIGGAGTVTFNGGTNTINASYNITGATNGAGGTTALNNVTNLGNLTNSGGSLTITDASAPGIGNITAQGGTLTLNIPVTLSIVTLTLSGGTLAGTASISLTGTSMTWTGGTLGGSGTLTIPAATTVTFSGYVNFDTRSINNAGSMVYSGGYYSYFYNGATLTNSGTIDFQGDAAFYIGSGSPSITNSGTIKKSGGTGNSALQPSLTAQSGSQLLVQSGTMLLGNVTSTGSTLSVASGTNAILYWTTTGSFDAASTISGAGTMTFSSGTNTMSASYNVTGATVSTGGTTALGTNITNIGNVTNSGGTLTISSSTTPGIGSITCSGGTLNLNIATGVSVPALVMSGGTLGGSAPISVTNAAITWTGGTLGGSGTLTIPSSTTLTVNGYVNFDTRSISNAGSIVYTGSYSTYFYNGASLTNSGTIDFQGDAGFYIGSGSPTVTNSGTIKKSAGTNNGGIQVALTLQSGAQLLVQSGGLLMGSVTSTGGTLSVASGTTAFFYWTTTATFDAASSLAGAGTVNFGNGTNTINATYNVTGATIGSGGTTSINAVSNLGNVTNSGGTLTVTSATAPGIGNITCSGGTLVLNITPTLSVPILTMSGGTLSGSAPISITGTTLTWTGGTVGGTGQLTIPNTTTINFNGYVAFDTRPISNAGSMVYTSSYYSYFYNGATLTNSGTIDFQGDAGFYIASGSPSVVNSGTIKKSAGTSNSGMQVALTLQSGGQVLVQTGTMLFGDITSSGGTINAASGATAYLYYTTTATFDSSSTVSGAGALIQGSGTNTFAGTLTASLRVTGGSFALNSATTQSIPSLTMQGGTFTGTGNLAVTAVAMTWTGGIIGGSGTLTIPAATTVGVNGTITISTRPVTSSGTINLTGSNAIYIQNDATVTNGGTIDIQGDGSVYLNSTPGATAIYNNGTIKKSGGTGITTFNVNLVANSGSQFQIQSGTVDFGAMTATSASFSVASGAIMGLYYGNVRTFDAGSTISGAGMVLVSNDSTTFSGTITTALKLISGHFTVNSATPQTVPVLTMAGGILDGSGNLTANGNATWTAGTFSGTGTVTIPSAVTITINGTITFDTATIANAGTIAMPSTNFQYVQNNAVINNSGTIDLQSDGSIYLNSTAGTTAIVNSGTIKKSGGTSISYITVPLTAQSGSQYLVQSGTVEAGAVTSSGATFNVSSGATLNFYTNDTRSFDSASTITGSGTLGVQNGTSTTAGSLSIATITMTGGTFTVNTATGQAIPTLNMQGGILNGTANLTVGSTVAAASDPAPSPRRPFARPVASPTMTWSGGTIGGSSIFVIATGATVSVAGYPTFDARAVTVSGTLALTSSYYIYLQNGAAITNNGTIDFQGDSTLYLTGGSATLTNNGTIKKSSGTGTSFIYPAMTNASAGTIAPLSGTISFQGTFSNAGTLDFPIAGATSFGKLNFANALPLGGTLTVTTTGGYAPSTGTAFQILAYPSYSGAFANKNLDYATGTFTETYSTSNLTVTAGPQALGITGLSPNLGTDAGGTTVTISGVDFQSGATVTFGGTAAASVTFNNSTSLTAVTPAHAAGPVDVVVTNPSTQTATLSIGYLFTGLVSQYSFETSGSLGADTAGTNNATNVVNVSQTAGKVGQAGSFVNGYMDLPQVSNLNLRSSDFTLEAWVNSSSTANLGWFTKETSLGAQQYGIGTANQTQAVFSFDGGTGGSVTSTSTVFDGTWHHVAAVKRGSIAEIWVDGRLEASGAVSGSSDSGAFAIGRSGACCDSFNGLIDEAKIYNYALSSTQIRTDALAADLAVTKSATGSVTVGQSITYTIGVTNNGPTNATGVTVTDNLPAATSYVSATPSQGSCAGTAPVVCSLGGLANGGTATITIVANAITAGSATNTASVTANEADPVSTNNSASASTSINSPTCSAPTITASGPTTFCAGGSVTLTANATGASAYQWYNGPSPIGGATASTYTATTSGNYTVQVTYPNTCSATSAATAVTVNANPPTPVVSASGATTFCQGGNVTLTAPGGYTYSWSTGATTQSINVTATGNYTVTVSDANGCSATSAATAVTVNALPNATITAPASICSGSSGTASVPITSGATYNWSAVNASINSGAGTDTISFTPSGTASITLNVTVTDTNGCSASSIATVAVGSFTPTITPSGPTTFCQGGSVTLTATAGASYHWSTGATTQSIIVTSSGTFTVDVTAGTGCGGTSAPVTVTVNPNATASVTASGPTTFCQGGSVTLTASPAASYLWSNGVTTQAITVTTSGTYSVTETTAAGCSATSSATTVSVNPNPVVTITGTTSICPGATATLNAGAGFTSYLWSDGETTPSISVTPAATTTYSVTVTNASGCSATTSQTVTVTSAPNVTITAPSSVCANSSGNNASTGAIAGATYAWSLTGGTITSGQGTNAITFTAANAASVTINLSVTSGGCSGSGTQSVSVIPAPSVTITGPSSVCPSATFTLDAGAGFSSYSWSTGATTRTITVSQTAQTTYSVTVANGSCTASASKSVTMSTGGGSVSITAPSSAASNSTGNTASVPAGPAGTTYNWSINGGTITSGQGTPSITWSAGAGTSATISITVMTSGCSSSGSVTVALSGTADLAVSIAAPSSVNTGDAFAYTIGITNAGPSTAKSVTVTTTLPTAPGSGSASGTGWSCSAIGNVVTCSAQSVPVGAATSITINVTAPSSPGAITAATSISSSTTDPNSANNSASVATNVTSPAPVCGTTAPSLIAPANGASNLTNPITFSWSSVAGATAYDLWIGSNGAAPSVAASSAQTTATVSLPSGPSVWFVAARFANGCPALTSNSRNFTVAAAANCNHGIAQLIAPAAGATVASPVTFQWTAVPAAIGYRVWVAIDGGGAQDVGSTDGALTLTAPIVGSSISWYVEALFPGCPSTNSAPSSFSIPSIDPCAGHAAVTLTAPANQSTVASSSVQFQWSAVANANGYRVWTAVNGGAFTAAGTTDSASTTLTANIASGNVEWYVQSLFDGCPGVESAHFTFTVPQAPSCASTPASLVAPANGTTVTNGSVQFSWTPVAAATSYEVWLSLNHGAPALIGTTSSASLTHDVPAGALQWFVRTNFNGCPPLDSAPGTFTYTPPPNCTTESALLSAPEDGDTTAAPVDFRWGAVPGASQYKVWLARNGAVPAVQATANANHLDAQPLQPGSYSWSVEADFTNGCTATRSAASSFVVPTPPPPCTPPVPPALRATSTTSSNVNYAISWPRVANAAFYEYEESRTPDFAGAVAVTTYDTSVALHHPNTTATPIVFYYRARTVSTCEAARSLFSNAVVVAILPSQVAGAQATGATPADDPQNVTYTLMIGGNTPGAIGAQPGQTFSVVPTASWITANPPSGTVATGGTPVTVTANTSGLPVGTSTGAVTVLLGNAPSPNHMAPRDATSTSTTTVSVNLVQAASPTPKNAPPPNALIIPAVAHADGINSHFQSDVRITNAAPQVQRYQLTFTPTGVDGNKNGLQTNVAIDPGTTLALDDIMNAWFSSGAAGASASGTLDIRPLTTTTTSTAVSSPSSNAGVPSITTFASSRTYNTTASGTYGQYIPAIPFSTFIGAPAANAKQTVLSMQQIAQSSAYRTNVGLVEGSGSPATVLLSVFGDDGTKLGDFTQQLNGGQHLQLNSFLATNNLSVNDGRIEVRVTGGSGKVTAYASVVDNATNDPLLVTPVQANIAGANKWVIPGVADLNNGVANWRSDVRLFNAGASAVNATLTYIAQDGSAPQSKSISIGANEVKQIDGILQNVFGVTNSGGALQITTDGNAPLVATARTFNQTSNGTYGQFIPAVTLDDTASKGGRALQILQVEESDRYRSNIGVTEVSGNGATVEISAIPADSKTAVTTQVTLAPNEFKQYGSLLKSMGIDRAYNARVTVRVVDGDGRVAAYASVIDQATQDPTYVPAQ